MKPHPIDDGGWNADCHAGLTQARDILGYAIATALNFNNVQAGFLAAAMAALLTQTGSVGYIGGDEISSTIVAWDDPAKAQALAEEQMASQNALNQICHDIIAGSIIPA